MSVYKLRSELRHVFCSCRTEVVELICDKLTLAFNNLSGY